MQGFEYSQPTQVIFGDGAARRAGSFARLFGSRALLVIGAASARATGALGDVVLSMQAQEMPFKLLEGVPSNPGTAVVDAGAVLARSVHAEVVVAVGGGSVIDTAKAISVAAVSHLSYRGYLSGVRSGDAFVTSTLPVIAVPTLPGSGSETNGTSVIVDDISGRKLSAHSELAIPRVALIDPIYAAQAPQRLLAAGFADALCHAIEAGLSTRASVASDALAEAATAILRRDAAAALHERAAQTGDVEAVGRCLWAANLAGQALSLAGSTVTHPLAHPLSARFGAHHGEAVAALEPAVIAALADRWGDAAVKVAGWFGSRATAPVGAVKSLLARLAEWNAAAGVTTSVAALGLDAEHVEDVIADALASGSRGLANTPGGELAVDDLRAVLGLALAGSPQAAPPLTSRR